MSSEKRRNNRVLFLEKRRSSEKEIYVIRTKLVIKSNMGSKSKRLNRCEGAEYVVSEIL